ncbi:MAG: AraC family transcriptional regulator [Opitutaceae bacterium]|nr:AraC family transcriptional regulator [Opitutaceae bacterium]
MEKFSRRSPATAAITTRDRPGWKTRVMPHCPATARCASDSRLARAATPMTDRTFPSTALSQHPLGPGTTLRWAPSLAVATDPTAAAQFAFLLPATRTAPGVMQFLPALGSAAPPACAFCVCIALDAAALRDLLAGDATPGAALLRAPAAPVLSLPLTAAARFAAESIQSCPFAGSFRAMALTARGHDLLLEFLTALANSASPPAGPITRALADRIHAAAEILKRRLENPPALPALAREVGLSETTLKRGFRQVFSTTPFAYLRARRMEHAHALLAAGEATVLEAAAMVGYSNPSNFAAAFRLQFGVNPKTFQLTARR